jgi:hypothetical protein
LHCVPEKLAIVSNNLIAGNVSHRLVETAAGIWSKRTTWRMSAGTERGNYRQLTVPDSKNVS